jgi:glycerol-3-phosphate dehydrogenase
LRDATIDVLILGGGINGAGIARDLGLRLQQPGVTLEVALVEQNQFGSGTSGRNSQLIHGGLRYLRYMQMGLVKESLRERHTLRFLAPHMVQPLPFLLPFHGRMEKLKYMMGLTMYDQLAGDFNIAKHREISKAEIAELEPSLDQKNLSGGAIFYDCHVNSARFVLENLFDAAGNGVLLANHTRAELLEREAGGNWKVQFEDLESGEKLQAHARKVIDARGAWSETAGDRPRLVRGSHLILPRLTAEEHAVAYFDENGRIVFLIPWGEERQFTLLGTTEVDHDGAAGEARISPEEVQYLLGIARKLYPQIKLDPIAAFSSLRALVASDGSATAASREHKIFNSADGILRIQGGKYTTYRVISEQAVHIALKDLAPWLVTHDRSATEPLCGHTEKALARFRADAQAMGEKFGIPRMAFDVLIHEYGIHTPDLLAMIPTEDWGPLSRIEYGRMAYAVEREMALHLSDFLFVSTYFGYTRRWDRAQLEPYAQLMGSWLGWDAARQAQEIDSVLEQVALPGNLAPA